MRSNYDNGSEFGMESTWKKSQRFRSLPREVLRSFVNGTRLNHGTVFESPKRRFGMSCSCVHAFMLGIGVAVKAGD